VSGATIANGAAIVETRISEMIHAIEVPSLKPLVARPCIDEHRELNMGRDGKGDVALRRCLHDLEIVPVLAIRGREEAGFENSWNYFDASTASSAGSRLCRIPGR
jgi:hypothetical protein